MKIVGVGKSLAERIANGSYTGDPRDFTFDLMRRPKVLWQFGLSVAKVQIVFGD